MITTWNKTLDVRLLFSGIFSAIVMPFIVESYKLLETQSSSQPSPSFFGRDGYKVRVNAMWFSSLIFSLVAAMLSIHCKQWLDGYGVDLVFAGAASGCPESLAKACRLRQYRYQGLHVYGIPSLIDMLPVLLYTALVLFAIGLIDFLWHLNEVIAIYISCLCGIVVVAHVGSTLVPCFTTASPFKTPLSNLLGNMSRKVRGAEPLEKEEMNDVRNRKDCLDEIGYKWLMEHTRSEEVYLEAYNAHKEYLHLRELSKAKSVPG
ncbi:hypothetical protein PILCRDRAFT_209819 [Piloderma croceum F 1598]|uniref:DUF6535 domain-containing protein n=1 Tax=Piloderma croceum (strain F 1598) TaxID=765440 RepID=A0A0C3GEJ1_PILCF|nr:hypothetical protein PILCRDRAFT_209819 [Piloderma croceum F 1598]